MKRSAIWVSSRTEARVFPNAAAAINHCLALGIHDVHLVKLTDDGQVEGYLRPFGPKGLDLGTHEMVAELRKSIDENRALREKQQELKKQIDDVTAETKEVKKRV